MDETDNNDETDVTSQQLEDNEALEQLDKDMAAMKFPTVPKKTPVVTQQKQVVLQPSLPVRTIQASSQGQLLYATQTPISKPVISTQLPTKRPTVVAQTQPQPPRQIQGEDQDEEQEGLKMLEKLLKN